jgi:ElaB/YqjD/DUF883 family membrane-anchored ribosome-binding protein
MLGSSRYTRAISAQAGEIEQRLRALEKRLENVGTRASTNAQDTAENLGDAIASALSGWADRFRQGASTVGDQSAALGKDATKLGTVALNRIADETGRRPLFALAVAVGVGILIGMAARNSRMDSSR